MKLYGMLLLASLVNMPVGHCGEDALDQQLDSILGDLRSQEDPPTAQDTAEEPVPSFQKPPEPEDLPEFNAIVYLDTQPRESWPNI